MMSLDDARMQPVIQATFDKANSLRRQMAITKIKVELGSRELFRNDFLLILSLSPASNFLRAGCNRMRFVGSRVLLRLGSPPRYR